MNQMLLLHDIPIYTKEVDEICQNLSALIIVVPKTFCEDLNMDYKNDIFM
jgi:hypothetical protein